MNTHPISLVVFDMAGTTVEDSGLVQQSLAAADEQAGLSRDAEDKARMLTYVTDTMGQSKIEVFRHLSGGNEEQAQSANKAFERCYGQLVRDGHCSAIPGADQVLKSLRSDGVGTALTTGFAHETQQAIITALGWHDIADIVLCPGDDVRGQPFPDMPLTALLRTGADTGMVRLQPLRQLAGGVHHRCSHRCRRLYSRARLPAQQPAGRRPASDRGIPPER